MSVDDKYRQWADDDPENYLTWQQYQDWKEKITDNKKED